MADTFSMLQVKVVPGSSRDQVAGRWGEGIKVRVAAPPDKGRANQAVIQILAQWLGVKPAQVELIRGQTNPLKTFRISGLDESMLRNQLALLD